MEMKKLFYLSMAILMMLLVVSCKKDDPRKKIPVPEAIDLGIEITRTDGTKYNLKWASFNLGASKPEEYGYYYAWGETEWKWDYSWSTYKFGTSSFGPFSKYNSEDGKTILDPTDDVAHVKLDGKWRLPTDAEWEALLDQCTLEWKDDYNGTGISGRLVTATNGNSIFLPAAGGWYDTGVTYNGLDGDYCSSSLCTEHLYAAWNVRFNKEGVRRGNFNRNGGRSVRPVTELSLF
ncbi:MAG: hypothetical protein IK045_00900 [Bacteroidales bacterium]|nr:hypothetical protein [Bacteroidales bacterium]